MMLSLKRSTAGRGQFHYAERLKRDDKESGKIVYIKAGKPRFPGADIRSQWYSGNTGCQGCVDSGHNEKAALLRGFSASAPSFRERD
jgi:hypothetical protein